MRRQNNATGRNAKAHVTMRLLCATSMLVALFSFSAIAQQADVYSVYFSPQTLPVSYVAGWRVFCDSLKPGEYGSVTMRGTYDTVGRTCKDLTIVNDLAAALKNRVDYVSPMTPEGYVWRCDRSPNYSITSDKGVWVEPPAYSGGTCPANGYVIRPANAFPPMGQFLQMGVFRIPFWGGVNTSTCQTQPAQLMELIFNRCYMEDGAISCELLDANGAKAAYLNVPGTLGVHCSVSFPDLASNVTVTLQFFNPVSNTLVHTATTQMTKMENQTLDDIQSISIPGIAPGTYYVKMTVNTVYSCGEYSDYNAGRQSLMVLEQGDVPCLVWPGDVNNDGVVNYGDRKSLNTYISDANFSALWLTGPARYRVECETNPAALVDWEMQAAVPWETVSGCYMDTDGNGSINSYDNIPIRTNWMREHGAASPKGKDNASLSYFDISPNFPNPFNPSTQIQVHVPEPSHVRIVVKSSLGREVTTLINQDIAPGTRIVTFDGAGLESGVYFATATLQGLESKQVYTETIRMTLTK